MNDQVLMDHQVLTGEKPRWLKIMAGPIFFAVLGIGGYLLAEYTIDPAPPGQLGPGFWPKMCLGAIAFAAIIKAFEVWKSSREAAESCVCKEMDNRMLSLMIGLIVLAVPAISFLGFPLTCFLFFWSFLRLAGLKKITTLFLISFFGTIGLIYTFVKIVYLPLPKGAFFFEDITLLIYRVLFII
ncbi:MAG: tripartite tricarboxylate transporter TctB family protein [Syntrophobacteraceae bacterium]